MARQLAMATRGKQRYTVSDLYYLAGVVDSDGCIGIGKMMPGQQRTKNPRYVLNLTVVNTSVSLMNWLVDKFGGAYRIHHPENPKHKGCYTWSHCNARAAPLLEELAPLLIVKPKQAMLGVELIANWVTPPGGMGMRTDPKEVARREKCYQRMRALNKLGPLVQPQRLSPLAPKKKSWGDAIV